MIVEDSSKDKGYSLVSVSGDAFVARSGCGVGGGGGGVGVGGVQKSGVNRKAIQPTSYQPTL